MQWRYTIFLKRRAQLERGQFVDGLEDLFACIAALPERPSVTALDRPFDPLPEALRRIYGDRFDAVGVLEFATREHAVRSLLQINADPTLRAHAHALIDRAGCSAWLAEVFPVLETPGTGVVFVVAGQTVAGMPVEQAQAYWGETHPVVFRAVTDFMAYITRYVQMHGRDTRDIADVDVLGRYDFHPMCADMGLRRIEDVAVAYSMPSYMSIIRPDELKFANIADMLAFASRDQRVF